MPVKGDLRNKLLVGGGGCPYQTGKVLVSHHWPVPCTWEVWATFLHLTIGSKILAEHIHLLGPQRFPSTLPLCPPVCHEDQSWFVKGNRHPYPSWCPHSVFLPQCWPQNILGAVFCSSSGSFRNRNGRVSTTLEPKSPNAELIRAQGMDSSCALFLGRQKYGIMSTGTTWQDT